MLPNQSTRRPCPMDEHERFSKLYDFVVEIFRMYSANFVWTVGLLALANGWFLSSESSRAFVRGNLTAFVGGILAIFLLCLLHTASSFMYYQRSQAKIAEISAEYDDLHPLPFREYEVKPSILVINLAVAWTLAAGLIAFLVAARMG